MRPRTFATVGSDGSRRWAVAAASAAIRQCVRVLALPGPVLRGAGLGERRLRPHGQLLAWPAAPAATSWSSTAELSVASPRTRRPPATAPTATRATAVAPTPGRGTGGGARRAAAPSASASTGVKPTQSGWSSRLKPPIAASQTSSPRARRAASTSQRVNAANPTSPVVAPYSTKTLWASAFSESGPYTRAAAGVSNGEVARR